jgi:hypothetical protein
MHKAAGTAATTTAFASFLFVLPGDFVSMSARSNRMSLIADRSGRATGVVA